MNYSSVLNKKDMYRRLAAGEFGNTVPQWFSVELWEKDAAPYSLWGIRSGLAGGDKRMRLNVPTQEVADLYRSWFPQGGGNISPMIDMYVELRGEVVECPDVHPGLLLFHVEPGKVVPEDPWRGSFKKYGQQKKGLAAWNILKTFLWPSDLEDLKILLDIYPEHVIEFSACNRAVGVIPHRNTVIWEVRKY